MTWAEFQLRLFAYKRQRKAQQADLREVAWAALISFNVDPKALKSKEKYWPIYSGDNKTSRVSEQTRNAFNKAMLDYQKQVNGKPKG